MELEVGKIEGKRCPICGKESVYIGKADGESVDDDGTVLFVTEYRTCECFECGAPIYNEKVERFNRISYGESVREWSKGYLSVKQIRSMPPKYGVTRKNFRKILGIPDEHKDFDDYEPFLLFDGDLPTYEEEEVLEAVYNDPNVFLRYLEEAKDELTKDDYDKSFKKTMELIRKAES